MSDFEIKDGVLIKYNGNAGRVVVPDNVTEIGGYAFACSNSLCEIFIPRSVTEIGVGAFSYCTSLREVAIPDGVTKIQDKVFDGCIRLCKITIPEGVTEIGWNAFDNCAALSEITIPDSVERIGFFAFKSCISLREITIPEGVTELGWGVFEGCVSLGEITVCGSITKIGSGAFLGCNALIAYVPRLNGDIKICCDTFKHALARGYMKFLVGEKNVDDTNRSNYLEYFKAYGKEAFSGVYCRNILSEFRNYIIKNNGLSTVFDIDTVVESEIFSNDAEIVTILLSCRVRLGGKGALDDLEL